MSRPTEGKEYLPLAEAAARLGTTVTRILMLIKQGKLRGQEHNGDWLVESGSLEGCNIHRLDIKTTQGCASHCTGCGCA